MASFILIFPLSFFFLEQAQRHLEAYLVFTFCLWILCGSQSDLNIASVDSVVSDITFGFTELEKPP